MAVGLGRIFGFKFLENFQYPYIASSITDFWRRWHISLSDLVPQLSLYPTRRQSPRRPTHVRESAHRLFAVRTVARRKPSAWNFIVWGLFHGSFLGGSNASAWATSCSAIRPVRTGYALLVVMIGWVFFRATSLSAAMGYLAAQLTGLCRRERRTIPRWHLFDCRSRVRLRRRSRMFSARFTSRLGLGVQRFLQGQAYRPVLQQSVPNDVRRRAAIAVFALLQAATAVMLAVSTYNPFYILSLLGRNRSAFEFPFKKAANLSLTRPFCRPYDAFHSWRDGSVPGATRSMAKIAELPRFPN